MVVGASTARRTTARMISSTSHRSSRPSLMGTRPSTLTFPSRGRAPPTPPHRPRARGCARAHGCSRLPRPGRALPILSCRRVPGWGALRLSGAARARPSWFLSLSAARICQPSGRMRASWRWRRERPRRLGSARQRLRLPRLRTRSDACGWLRRRCTPRPRRRQRQSAPARARLSVRACARVSCSKPHATPRLCAQPSKRNSRSSPPRSLRCARAACTPSTTTWRSAHKTVSSTATRTPMPSRYLASSSRTERGTSSTPTTSSRPLTRQRGGTRLRRRADRETRAPLGQWRGFYLVW
mmetsp:Transcript_3762/g.9499  ORF Transcript_3762/g.9499 Transcript_3762/m.9499 type:complete len:297 (-) Transcript_3762:179-1069(-)